MGKKRRRAPNLGEDIVIDPKYFDHPVEQDERDNTNYSTESPLKSSENVSGPITPETETPSVPHSKAVKPKAEPGLNHLHSPQHPESHISEPHSPHQHSPHQYEDRKEQPQQIVQEETQSDWPEIGYVDNSVEEISLLSDDTALPSSREPFSAHMTASLTDAIMRNDRIDRVSKKPRQSLDSDVLEISDSDSDGEEEEVVELLSSSTPSSPHRSSSIETAQATHSVSTTLLPPVEITLVSHIPDNAVTRTQTWGAKSPFYALEKEFGRESVLVYQDKAFKKFQTPNRIDPNTSVMEIHIYTERQWRAKELGELEDESAKTAATAADTDTDNDQSTANEFPVKVEGKEHKLRTLVHNSTTIRELADRYIGEFNIASSQTVKVLFDGDPIDLTTTVGELDMEEDDILNIYH